MKEKVEKYEFIYDVPPEEKLKQNNPYFNIINPGVNLSSLLTFQAPNDEELINKLKTMGASAALAS